MRINEFKYFYPEKPILATIDQISLFDDRDYVAEKKYNGTRLELHYINNEFEFWNRHGEKIKFSPDNKLFNLLYKLYLIGYNVFDGELRHNKVKGIYNKIIIYDIFIYKNNLLINKTFRERRKILETIFQVKEKSPLSLSRQFYKNFKLVFKNVIRNEEIEGIVIKKLDSKFNLSRIRSSDSSWMYKIRKPHKNYKF